MKDKSLIKAFRGLIEFRNQNFLFGGRTGRGKTTANANIIAHYLKNNEKVVWVALNDEPAHFLHDRIACLNKGYDWIKFKNNLLPDNEVKRIKSESKLISKRVWINQSTSQGGFEKYNPELLKDVQKALLRAKHANVGLFVIDYLQRIDGPAMDKDTAEEKWKVYQILANQIHQMNNEELFATILFVQMKDSAYESDFFSRIEGSNTLGANFPTAIEIIPNFKTQITRFIVHKDKYGQMTGKGIEAQLTKGKFIKPKINI